MPEVYCDTGKQCFESPAAAAPTKASLSKRGHKKKYSTYRCQVCGFFHITTSSKKLIPKRGKKWK